MAIERLDKVLARQGIGSRREVKELVRQKQVTVNGRPAASAEEKVDPDRDILAVSGRALTLRRHLYLMMNKPKGVVSATRDGACPTVLDLVPEHLRRRGLFPAGRLDKDTVGFVLLTDDGDFAHRMLSPKRHVPKTYHAQLERPITDQDVQAFAQGMTLANGEVCLPAQLQPLPQEEGCPMAQVILREGMYHQIKRMFAARGNRVVELRRVKLGNLPLDPTLKPGECREINDKELEQIL